MEPSSTFSEMSDASVSEDKKSPRNHTKYKDIISALPQKTSWGQSEELREYQGFWCFPTLLERIMEAQQHFIARHTDIIACSHPKSGTTWLKALCFAILTRAGFSNSSTNSLFTKSPHDVVPWIEFLAFVGDNRDHEELPLLATHIPYNCLPKFIVDSNCKIIYICRDPRDVLVSIWQFAGKVRGTSAEAFPLEKAYDMFCEGVNAYGPYWDHVLGYWKASLQLPERILFIRYEDLHKDTFSYVKRLAEFMGFPFSVEEERRGLVQEVVDLCSFENLSNLEVNKSTKQSAAVPIKVQNNYYFRKGKVGDWKNYLTAEMAATLDQITENKFSGYGLSFRSS